MPGEPDLRERMTGEDARRRLLATAPVAERRLDLANVSTTVLEGGDGPPVVLLHGPGAYGSTWLPVLPAPGNEPALEAPEAFLRAAFGPMET